ncbi:MAG: class I SAM-dependent methyltransferase [Isosphaeraceae bacterium]
MSSSSAYVRHVAHRFDELAGRFPDTLDPRDFRLSALGEAIGPWDGRVVLDLGCGKGRFGRHLRDRGARVVGLDVAFGMLDGGDGPARVQGSALSLPFRDAAFDVVLAVEMIQHLPPRGLERVLAEIGRVLKPEGHLAVIDRNPGALDPKRPWLPALVVKEIDQARGRWMYPRNGPVQERWQWPARFGARMSRLFDDVAWSYLLSPAEANRPVFRRMEQARRFVLWTARGRGDSA